MILAFADDSTMRPLASVVQANSYCEPEDVDAHVYVFLDERGIVLRPVFREAKGSKWRRLLDKLGPKIFDLERTGERRDDLLRRLGAGEITISEGPTEILSLADLRREMPELLKQDGANK